jgi:hypothetical protein
MTNSEKTDKAIIVGFIAVLIILFASMTFSEYLSYLSVKAEFSLIELALTKDLSAEQIQGLLNSKNQNIQYVK